jgi:hypothetical protein
MNKILEYVKQELGLDSDQEAIDEIRESDIVYRSLIIDRRWWHEYLTVVKIGDKYISFIEASTTGDKSPLEVGFDFDPTTICEVVPKEVTIVKFVKVDEE